MSKHRAVRAVVETGSTTGAATVVLALLSAGALAGLGLVAATELAPGPAPSVAPDSADRAVKPPRSVVVTPQPGKPTGANPTPGTPPAPGTPTPLPGTVPGTVPEPAVPEPAVPEPLPPILAGPLLPTPGVVPGVVSPGVLTPSAPFAPVPRQVAAPADKPGSGVAKGAQEKAAKAKQAKKAKKARKAQAARDAQEAREEKAAANHASVKKAAKANKAAKASKAHKSSTKKVAGKHRR